LLAGFCLPVAWLVDSEKDEKGALDVRYRIPYSDLEQLSAEELARFEARGEPLAVGHSLDAQILGQLDAGLLLAGYYDDNWPAGKSALAERIPLFAATRALKPRGEARPFMA
jgi:hypothetical protein